jgi:hypothetical protein
MATIDILSEFNNAPNINRQASQSIAIMAISLGCKNAI